MLIEFLPPAARLAAHLHSELSFSNCLKGTGIENRRSASHSSANPRFEIAADPSLDLGRAAVGLKALEVEAQFFDAPPEMGVVDVAAVGVERVDHREERALSASRLGGGVQRRRARVLAGDREVTEDEPARVLAQATPGAGAMRATEVGVDD